MTMTLPPEPEIVVAEKARAEGVSAEAYVERPVRDATAQGAATDPGAAFVAWPSLERSLL